jgi:Spy/CpxP family protein refolding chaperone
MPVFISGTAEAQQSTQVAATAPAPTVDEVVRSVRADLQGKRADIMAKNLTLTAEQAAKFWPLFEKYQQEQNAVIDEQLKNIQTYVDNYQNLDDAQALALINAHLDQDAKMNALQQKWLAEFQKVLPAKLAAQAMQIDRRLSLAAQIEIAARIPLIH